MSDLTLELINGYRAEVTCEHDTDHGAPWKEEDGHGPVSDWVRRDKAPGERVLYSERGESLFYDFAAAVELAKKDGWDTPPYGQGTKGERAVRAAEADFERMRKFACGAWGYIGVCVDIFDRDDNKVHSDSFWGVESDGDYWKDCAREMADCFMAERSALWRRHLAAARIERRRLLDTICYG